MVTTEKRRGYPIIAHTQRQVRTTVAMVSPRVARETLVPGQQPFHVDNFRVTLAFGRGVRPSRVGDVEHHQHAMTASVKSADCWINAIGARCLAVYYGR